MLTGHARKIAPFLIATGVLSGCAQTDSLFPRQAMLGSLKTSVSQLEFRNESLRTEVAQLKEQNREIEDQLVQEQSDNGDLKARLDNARYELSKHGIDAEDIRTKTSRRSADDPDSATTIPAGQSSRKKRKPPFAQIPNRIEEPIDLDEDEEIPPPRPRMRPKSESSGHTDTRFDDPGKWLPVAKGTSEPSQTTR
ncbi:hypothetical protein [Singulisphaera sp. PoT]|uniref:hypothetical protein n=1 Tax=Singulisphaera sp. PoT TaxID=3411797 RepID=UPI003BF60D0F